MLKVNWREPARRIALLGAACLFTISTTGVLAGEMMPPVPDDYPSHLKVGDCNQDSLQQHLQHYNETRLDLAEVLRHFASDYETGEKARAKLGGYATHLDEMRQRLPPPDPDSHEFQNFDFRLGMALTSMMLFLNTEDEHLTQRFVSDRDNPDSELGIYLTRLEDSRTQYTDKLAAAKESGCRS